MTPALNSIVLVCMVAWCALAFIDLARSRSWGRFLLEAGLLVVATLILRCTLGFPHPELRQSFGTGTGSLATIGLMFLCIALGMVARHMFCLRGRFIWLPLLRPLFVSPIVLLPLLGTLQSAMTLEPIQVLSFCLLSFQNGFFWRVIFERVNATVQA